MQSVEDRLALSTVLVEQRRFEDAAATLAAAALIALVTRAVPVRAGVRRARSRRRRRGVSGGPPCAGAASSYPEARLLLAEALFREGDASRCRAELRRFIDEAPEACRPRRPARGRSCPGGRVSSPAVASLESGHAVAVSDPGRARRAACALDRRWLAGAGRWAMPGTGGRDRDGAGRRPHRPSSRGGDRAALCLGVVAPRPGPPRRRAARRLVGGGPRQHERKLGRWSPPATPASHPAPRGPTHPDRDGRHHLRGMVGLAHGAESTATIARRLISDLFGVVGGDGPRW